MTGTRATSPLRWLCLLLGCSSCLIRAVGPAQAAPAATIHVWDYPRWVAGPDSLDRFHWIRTQIAAFEAAHPDVNVELTRLSWEYGADKVRVAVLAGVGPDIIAGAPLTEFIARGLVEPVDAFITPDDRADYLPSALDAFAWRGHIWGWPWYQTGSVLLLNRNRFEQAGVALPDGGVWTRGEFEGALARLSSSERGPARYGLGFAVGEALSIWPWLFPGPEPLRAAVAPLEDARTLGGIAQLRSYIERGWAPPGSGGVTPEPVWQAFAVHERAAIAPFGVWAIPALRERAKFGFEVAAYPDDVPTFVAVSGWMVLRQSDPAQRAAAMALARHLTAAEQQRDLKAYGVFPTRRSTGLLYEDDPAMARAAEIFERGRPVPLDPQWPQFQDVVTRAVQQALTGTEPGAAMADAAARMRELEARTLGSGAREAQPTARVRGGVYGLLAAVGLALGGVAMAGRGVRWRFALFAFPAMALLGALMLWPLAWSVLLSFGTFDIATGWIGEWVGARHYVSLLRDSVFRVAVRNTVLYTAVVVPVHILVALVAASLIAPLGARMRAWFRGAFYVPGVTSVVVLSLVWKWMFNEDVGALNGLLGFWGAPPVRWLSDPAIALWSIVLMSVARPPGGPILIYLAALDAVPHHLHEAAALDGASAVRRWRHVTVPLLGPTTRFLVITGCIASFQVFAQVYLLTDGGPGTATTVLVHQIYTTAMRDFAFGRASAMAVILACLLAGAAFVQTRRRIRPVEF